MERPTDSRTGGSRTTTFLNNDTHTSNIGGMDANKLAQELLEPKKSKEQTEQSLELLSQKLYESTNLVTSTRVEGDANENERRIKEEIKRETIQQRLQNESMSSAKRNAAVQMKWSEIKEKKIPLQLQEDLDAQQKACQKIIRSKNAIVKELQDEIRSKDEEYVNSLRTQSKDIDILLSRMRQLTRELTENYDRELNSMEFTFKDEREELLSHIRKTIDQIKDERSLAESKYISDRIKKVEENESELKQTSDDELYRYEVTKKELHDNIHELQQQQDHMRSEYMLSSEKLKYFYNILESRVKENETAKRTNKDKLSRLQDQLSSIKAKYARDDKKFKSANNEITEKFEKLAKQYKDLQLKFKYFEDADTLKYRDIWRMNQEIAEELANHLLKADEIITEQQLGLTWIPPEEDFFNSPLENNRKTLNATGSNDGNVITKDNSGGNLLGVGGVSNANNSIRRQSVDGQSAATSESRSSNVPGNTQVFISPTSETTKIIMNTLCNSAGFLVEDKVKKVLSKLESDEAKLLKVDSIMRTLGIENPEDIQKLMSYFVQIIEETRGQKEEMESKDEIGNVHLAMDDVVKALRRFVEAQQKALMNQNRSTKQKKAKILNAEERAKDRRRKEEREFWTRMTQVIPDSKYRVWGALERGLEKYGVVLEEREKLIAETEHIRKQNNDLRLLLDSYMSQKINDELILPPHVENLDV
jgi:dynein regulatory complex protein 1